MNSKSVMTDKEAKMYKGFFEDLEYVMGLFFKPFEGCCEKDDDEDEDEKKGCGMGCDFMPCWKERDDDEDDAEEETGGCGIMQEGPVQDILKCLFDASDIDYDYEE